MARKRCFLLHTCATRVGGIYTVGDDCHCRKRVEKYEAWEKLDSGEAQVRPGYDYEIILQRLAKWRRRCMEEAAKEQQDVTDKLPDRIAVLRRSMFPSWGHQLSEADIGRLHGAKEKKKENDA